MNFLCTTDKLSIIEFNDLKSANIVKIKIEDEWLDLPLNKFIGRIINQVNLSVGVDVIKARVEGYNRSKFVVIQFVADECPTEDIEYAKEVLMECAIEGVTYESPRKFEKEIWQPVQRIVDMLNLTMKAQTRILNYSSVIKFLNIQIVKEGEVLFDMVKQDHQYVEPTE